LIGHLVLIVAQGFFVAGHQNWSRELAALQFQAELLKTVEDGRAVGLGSVFARLPTMMTDPGFDLQERHENPFNNHQMIYHHVMVVNAKSGASVTSDRVLTYIVHNPETAPVLKPVQS